MISLFSKTALISKSNVYGKILFYSLLVLITIIISSEPSFVFGDSKAASLYGPAVLIIVLLFYCWQIALLVQKLNYPSWLTGTLKAFAIANFLLSLLTLFGGFDFLPITYKVTVFFLGHMAGASLDVLILAIILTDIFASKETHGDHIWGAIVAYFALIMLFGETYELITLVNPGLLGEVFPIGYPNYVQCIMFSFNIMAGIDSFYPDAHPILMKISALEHLIGNLYLVVILGRLLSRPIKNKEPQKPKTS